jgi:small subunit ribosomal protein S9
MARTKKTATTEEVKQAPVVAEKTSTTHEKRVKLTKGFVNGTGRRKTAVATIFIWEEKGEFTVNEQPINDFFKSELEQNTWVKPFHLVGVSHPKAKYRASIKVYGSGPSSQLGATVHAISRALAKMSEENHAILAKAGMLTRDSRMVERKKPFLHKARKRPQYSKR